MLLTVLLEMEFEIYESELADYSLQDSPFYEASTSIIFGITTTTTSQTTVYGSNHHHSAASMVDALNLTAKKSALKMMSTKCQQQQHSLKSLAFERSPSNGIGLSKTNDDAGDTILSKKSRGETIANRHYGDKRMDTDRDGCNSDNMQPKKKRKCVSFLPNYVQVRIVYYLLAISIIDNKLLKVKHRLQICSRISENRTILFDYPFATIKPQRFRKIWRRITYNLESKIIRRMPAILNDGLCTKRIALAIQTIPNRICFENFCLFLTLNGQ